MIQRRPKATPRRTNQPPAERPLRIAVCGPGRSDARLNRLAEVTGAQIARQGAVLLCGGLGGVMEAAARGAHDAGGLTIGILPGDDAARANPWIALPLATGMGEARNALVVRFADAVIAINGEWGTLSEIALAMKVGVPVVLLEPGMSAAFELETADDPEDAVRRALRHARRRRAQ